MKRLVTNIESQLPLPLMGVKSMAGKALFAQDRTDIPIELQRRLAFHSQNAPANQQLNPKSDQKREWDG